MKTILIVEDNPADIRLMDEAFRKAAIPTSRHMVGDGVEAMAFLRNEGQYRDAPRPDLILLDLNMPRKDGHEVVREIHADSELRQIPIIVFTGSTDAAEIAHLHEVGIERALVKPTDLDDFCRKCTDLVAILA